MIRKGTRNGASYWFCHSCRHYFSGRSRVDSSAIYRYYAEGTYTIAQIAERLGISCSTVKRRMKGFPLSTTSTTPRTVALQMDTTYWGQNFGVVLFMDAATHRILHFSFIYRKERIEDSLGGDSLPQRAGNPGEGSRFWRTFRAEKVLGTNSLPILPIPSNATHQTAAHQSPEASGLYRAEQEISLQLTQSDKKQFAGLLAQWHERWKAYLEEKTFSEDGASFTWDPSAFKSRLFQLNKALGYSLHLPQVFQS